MEKLNCSCKERFPMGSQKKKRNPAPSGARALLERSLGCLVLVVQLGRWCIVEPHHRRPVQSFEIGHRFFVCRRRNQYLITILKLVGFELLAILAQLSEIAEARTATVGAGPPNLAFGDPKCAISTDLHALELADIRGAHLFGGEFEGFAHMILVRPEKATASRGIDNLDYHYCLPYSASGRLHILNSFVKL